MKTRDWKILATTNLLALAMFSLTQSAGAAPPSYLNGMPSVERVLSEVHGTNALDTATRQHAALCLPNKFVNVATDATGQINQFDQPGLLVYTNIHNPAQRQQFYRFSVP
jgi:hypothetical protein